MKSTFIAPEVGAYLSENCTRPSPLLLRLRAETIAKTGEYSKMQVTPEQGAFLTLLVKLTDARRAIEVGTFTGYSSLCIAAGLPEGGHLITCEGVREWAAIGQRYWARAGLRDRVELRLGVAIDTLRDLPKIECFDFAFIDADKISYLDYYEEL
ncbi:MAG: O-methyltransferase, partial [Micromonosporaceae bacterium]